MQIKNRDDGYFILSALDPALERKIAVVHRFRRKAAALLFILGAASAQAEVKPENTLTGAPESVVTTCVACHGVAGAGTAIGGARLAGKNPDYLAHALSMFKEGSRKSTIMQAVAQNLSDSEIHELATFFSDQHPPRAQGAHAPSAGLVIAGRQLTETGAGPDVPACFSCHAAGGKGNGARFPSIAGEPAAFIVNRLHEFQERAKTTTLGPGTMTAVAAKMNEAQIQEAAAYLSLLEP
ncbi:MAG: c-type cytochrome [Pseudomonadota bacterium]